MNHDPNGRMKEGRTVTATTELSGKKSSTYVEITVTPGTHSNPFFTLSVTVNSIRRFFTHIRLTRPNPRRKS